MQQRGFEITSGVLSSRECDAILGMVSSLHSLRTRAGARHLMSIPLIAAVANDQRLRSIATSVIGPEALPFRATLFDKSADANWSVVWHQDTALPLRTRVEAPGWGPWSIKGGVHYAHAPASALNRVVALRLHLDDSTSTNGPLRVIAGSHHFGVLSDDEVASVVQTSPAVECLVPRGGVLAMRPLLIHSSSRVTSAAPRRVLHIEYAEEIAIQPGVELAAA